MARFIQVDIPARHEGLVRVSRGLEVLGQFNVTRAALAGLAVLGRPLTRAYAAWSAAARQRREDDKLWDVALSDARVMADLSRAMSQDAQRQVRAYY